MRSRKTDCTGMPVAPSIPGLTARIYAIAKKVVRPAKISVLTVVL